MTAFLTDRQRLIDKHDAVLKANKRLMDFRCGNCGKQYAKMSTDDTWHECPKCKRSIKA